MTVSSEVKRSDFAGNGSTTAFATGFRFLQNSDIKVILTVDATGVETVQTEITNYTLTGAGLDAGGTVTMLIAPPTGTTLTIKRDVPLTQGTDYIENDDFPAESHEEALDKLTMITQQIQEELDRSLKLSEAQQSSGLTLPAPVNGSLLRWDINDDLENVIQANLGTVNKNELITVFDTVSDMVISGILVVGDIVETAGYLTKGDGGDNRYEVVAAATGTVDGGSFINLATHQAKGIFPGGTISVDQFGARGDWTGSSGTDDSTEFQNAIDFLGVTAGVVTLGFTKKYSITSEIFVKAGVVLRGPYELPDPRAGVDLENFGGAIYLDSAVTIKMDEASSIRGVIIIRANTTFPATAANLSEWAGTAITITFDSGGTFAADGVYIGHNTIVGFNRAVDGVLGTNTENIRVSYNNIDCINGVFIGQAFDVCYVDHNHLWPMASHQNGTSPTDADLRRSGTGFHFKDVGDWHKITDNFTFGYMIGYKVENCNSIQLVNSSADYTATNVAGVIGFQVLGTSEETNLIACQAAGQKRGASVELGVNTNSVHFTGCTFWDNDDHHIIFTGGTGSVIGGKMRNGTNGVTLAGGKRVLVDNITFEDVATDFLKIDTGSTGDDFIVGQNKFIGTVGAASGLTTLSVASIDPLPMPDEHDVITVTGTTNFGTITTKQWPGRRITLIFTGVLTITDGATKMAGDFTTSADDTITYVSDGSSFFEISRSAN